MLLMLENHTMIHPLPLKHTTAIMQAMTQNMSGGVAPRNPLAIHPNDAIAQRKISAFAHLQYLV